ncbi:hypothetical protein KCM76_09880 [Zooshikella marina]|uniref:Uncharacterized protein n=1 Tax=Zooshikella ganghwensis TaxID=202772 RepID=A0A4P9VJJ0_9GAMM|nr:hypothetical protein [Zooshikella ganghwensis]MBU2706297.1 hypothetical protein [Zooshikella ganghwensis]RDH42407.1 hypothetical protein B9G39_02535 [Zooshikella ganghwensis]
MKLLLTTAVSIIISFCMNSAALAEARSNQNATDAEIRQEAAETCKEWAKEDKVPAEKHENYTQKCIAFLMGETDDFNP